MNLKLEHIAPRLPYELNLMVTSDKYEYLSDSNYGKVIGSIIELDCSELEHVELMHEEYWKPILRPLSDLTKEIEHKGEKLVPMIKFLEEEHWSWYKGVIGTRYDQSESSLDGMMAKAWFTLSAGHSTRLHTGFVHNWPKWIHDKLHEWHFDTDNLIEQGLAIDVNTLDKNPYA